MNTAPSFTHLCRENNKWINFHLIQFIFKLFQLYKWSWCHHWYENWCTNCNYVQLYGEHPSYECNGTYSNEQIDSCKYARRIFIIITEKHGEFMNLVVPLCDSNHEMRGSLCFIRTMKWVTLLDCYHPGSYVVRGSICRWEGIFKQNRLHDETEEQRFVLRA